MALTQQQISQIQAGIQTAQKQAQQIASQIGVLTQAKAAGMTITPTTTVAQAQQYLSSRATGGGVATPTTTYVPPTTGQVAQVVIPTGELPYQTYERITGQKWPGGTSSAVVGLLKQAGITATPGTASANLALQQYLIQQSMGQKTTQNLPAGLKDDQGALDAYWQKMVQDEKVPRRVKQIEGLMEEFRVPQAPSMVQIWQQLRNQYAIDKEEQELASLRQRINEITNLYETAIVKEEERYAPISIIRRRQERLTKDLQMELSGLSRREAALVDILNQKNKVISDLMQMYQWDYKTARENYASEYNTKFQMLQFLRGEEKEAENRAASNWSTLMNAVKDIIASGRGSWESLPLNVKYDLNDAAIRGGIPSGVSEWILRNTPAEKQIAFHQLSPDGTEILIQYKDGTFEVRKMRWVGKKTNEEKTDWEKATISQRAAAESWIYKKNKAEDIPELLKRLKTDSAFFRWVIQKVKESGDKSILQLLFNDKE